MEPIPPELLLDGCPVRFVTYQPGDPIPESALVEYTREAADLAAMPREQRLIRT
jgi:hypothetical protein